MGRGGGLQSGREACEFLTLQKGGAGKVLAMPKGGGHNKFWGCFYMVA